MGGGGGVAVGVCVKWRGGESRAHVCVCVGVCVRASVYVCERARVCV